VLVDCHKEDRQEDIYNNVQAASGSSEDSRCLLDAICGASTGLGVSLISCYSGQLCWGHVAVRYRPERVMRQFGYVQAIPAPPVDSWVSFNDIDDWWMHYSNHLAPAGEMCVVSGQCALDYIDWFFRISHPFTTTQPLDSPVDAPAAQPKHVPQVLESDIPQVLDDPARSDVDEPRHIVVSVTMWLDV